MHRSSEKGKKRQHFYICSVPFILGHDERVGVVLIGVVKYFHVSQITICFCIKFYYLHYL